jgi:AraC-like DNA-binding protein
VRSIQTAAELEPARRPSPARERLERIYATIRDRICLLEYQPGERLSEEQLAAEFAVSRTPIRRVLSRWSRSATASATSSPTSTRATCARSTACAWSWRS